MRTGIIGGGAMGGSIVAALLRAGVAAANEVTVAEKVRERAEALARDHGVVVTGDPAEAAKRADLLVLAVKPQDFDKAAASLRGKLDTTTTVISIMAGITLKQITAALQHEAVVRSIPNTPAQIGEGMTVWTCGPALGDDARERAARLLQALGREIFVPDERFIDMATALSGSGPAYVFLFIEALIDAGVHIGLTRDVASTLAIQTVAGSAIYARGVDASLAELRHQVTSPGGTTAAALHALESAGFRAAITDAVLAAYNRARELGKGEPGK